MAKKTYSEKLLDPRWQKKRLEILNRDNFTCRKCEDTENTLHVHHKYYESEFPWETSNEHLITYCADCHKLEEIEFKEYSKLFIDTFRKSGFEADALREFAWGLERFCIPDPDWKIAAAISYALRTQDVFSVIIDMYNNKLIKDKEERLIRIKENSDNGIEEPF
jgi:hypothetical protein